MADNPRVGARLRRSPDVRTVSRPVRPGSKRTFDLAYVREGVRGGTPLLIIPGGPGMASVLPYRRARKAAAARGFDVIMVEHRGVGLSRLDRDGADLPMEAMTVGEVVEDLAAVLDDCGARDAVVWGTSYGGYLAQAFGARYGRRVRGMVLDSTSSGATDAAKARDHVRRLLWEGVEPATAGVAGRLRALVASGAVPVEDTGVVVPVVYEFGGAEAVDRLVTAVADGRRRTWDRVKRLATREITTPIPFVMEFDLAGAIWYRELEDIRPDGEPLDTAVGFAHAAEDYPVFEGPPFDLAAEQRKFTWPTAVLSGAYDLRAVRPLAEEIVERLPDGVLVPFDRLGHSTLDRHPFAGLVASGAVAHGRHHDLPRYVERIEEARKPVSGHALGILLRASLIQDRILPV